MLVSRCCQSFQVIPQLIARVGSARTVIGKIILPLLIDIGKAHPHAAVYSLMVGAKSSSLSRSQAIQTVLDSMKDRYPDLIKQAQILSHELIRVSILWHEMWHEGLEVGSYCDVIIQVMKLQTSSFLVGASLKGTGS